MKLLLKLLGEERAILVGLKLAPKALRFDDKLLIIGTPALQRANDAPAEEKNEICRQRRSAKANGSFLAISQWTHVIWVPPVGRSEQPPHPYPLPQWGRGMPASDRRRRFCLRRGVTGHAMRALFCCV